MRMRMCNTEYYRARHRHVTRRVNERWTKKGEKINGEERNTRIYRLRTCKAAYTMKIHLYKMSRIRRGSCRCRPTIVIRYAAFPCAHHKSNWNAGIGQFSRLNFKGCYERNQVKIFHWFLTPFSCRFVSRI